MTDGIDNALPDVPGPGSRLTFDKLISKIRNSKTIVFPIYLDTEEENPERYHVPRAAYAQARASSARWRSVCGRRCRSQTVERSRWVYAQVVRDFSTVYSIGYRPTNKTLDGKWRNVEAHLISARICLPYETRLHAKLIEKS